MRTNPIVLVAAALLPVAASPEAPAGGQPDVAIVAAASNTAMPDENNRFTDVRDKLLATGLFNSVAIFNATAWGTVPTLEQLLAFDAVIVWSNDSFLDAVALGDVMADYVDAGGGVVVSVFANTSTNAARRLRGRWETGDYIAIPQSGGHAQGPGQLGTILQPDHPIMMGVDRFETRWGISDGQIFGGYRPVQLGLTPGSVKIAEWNTGHTLVAIAPNPRVVELGFHPVSSDVVASAYWDAETDGDILIANALRFVARSEPCPSDLDGDGQTGAADLAGLLGSWGLPGAADLDGDGVVGASDLASMLGSWGACP